MSTKTIENGKQTGNGYAGGPNQAGGSAGSAMMDDMPPQVGRRQLITIMVSVMLGLLLAALDQTVVGPALPKISGDLNGFDQYSWVATIYLLTSTISVPIFGKLSDMYGRKWFYIAGVVVFLIGSGLSGLSADIWQLIAFRGLQGLGAGIIAANAFAIIADLIPPADRGKWQGAFGAVFGLSSVVGPTIGGFLTDNLSWRWVFYVNLPVGIIALAALVFLFPNLHVKSTVRRSIDWAGAFTLVAGLTPVLTALSLGGTPDWDWGSGKVLGLIGVGVAFLIAFIFIESRTKEAIIPLDVFKNSIFTTSVITVFLTGVGLFGAVLYIPFFIQAIQGGSATSSGNAVTPLTMAIVVSSIITGQITSRTGKYRMLGIVGMALTTLGMVLLWTMNIDASRLEMIAFMVVMGLGLGVAFPLYTLAVQNAFPLRRVGVVTASVQFFRSMGATVGVAILGSVVNTKFHDQFPTDFANQYTQFVQHNVPAAAQSHLPTASNLLLGLGNLNPQALTNPSTLAVIKTQLIAHGTPANFADQLLGVITGAMKPALFSGINEAFLIGAIMLALGLVATMFLKEIPLRRSNAGGGMAAMAEGGAEAMGVEAGREMAASGMPAMTESPEEEPVLAPRS